MRERRNAIRTSGAVRALLLLLTLAGCGSPTTQNPYGYDAGADAAPDGDAEAPPPDAGEDAGPADAGGPDPTLGGPCLDDGQCHDDVECTVDRCDQELGRCRFTPDDAQCQNGLMCDGVERCDNKNGCVAGVPVGCDDGTSCTIDVCDEASQACLHLPRDADGDGDPDRHCGGHDCDDQDPTVSSLAPEVCGNGRDDDCDGEVDQAACVSPQHDTCLDPLVVDAAGTYALTTAGAAFDYPTSCGLGNDPAARDVVAALVLPAGPPVDVEVKATTQGYPVAVAVGAQCGDPSTELACGASFQAPMGGMFAKARARGLGSASEQKAYPVYVASSPGAAVALDVQIFPAAAPPTNETCGTAAPLTPGVPVTVDVLDAAQDLASACASALGELVYRFDLAAPADVDVYGSSVDGDGWPLLSLRGPGCALAADELACQQAETPHLFRHALPAGSYYVGVSASAPSTVRVTVDVSAPTAAPADETCSGAPPLAPNQTLPVTLAGHQDDVQLCLSGAVDAVYALDLPTASDVLLVERIAQSTMGAVGLTPAGCASSLVCQAGGVSPVRASRRNVPAGSYRVVAESSAGQDVELTAFVRPALPPTLVPFADACADAQAVPETGGFFQGNTANATADFPAGCDQGGVTGGGARDQLLSLTLSAERRVVLDMSGSGYTTVLDVRRGPPCPGTEVTSGCAVGYYGGRSYLDLVLPAGTYYIQVDGFNLDEGPWFLDVRVVDP